MPRRYQALDLYVTLVVATGAACAVLVLGTGYESLDRLLDPELALFALCALVGELVPLKVHTRGSEGEVTTSTCFALALMLAGGPAVAMVGLLGACIIADTIAGKPAKKVAFNAAQYAISVGRGVGRARHAHGRAGRGRAAVRAEDLIPIMGVAAVFFVVNSALVSTVVALAQGVIKLGRYLANDLFFQASTAGLLLGLSPGRGARRRVQPPRAAAAPAAVPRGPPRRPRGDRQGAPVAARRAHRPARTARCSATASSRRSPPAGARTSPRP